MNYVLVLLIFKCIICFVESSHFFGGSISAKFIADTGPTTLLLQYQMRLGWRRDFASFSPFCSQTQVNSGLYYNAGANLVCRANCFSTNIAAIKGYCIAFNVGDNWAYWEDIVNVTVVKNRQFVEGSYASGAWIPLNNPSSSGGNWEVRTRVDTTFRNDINSYNTCPTTIMPPVIKLRLGIRQDFAIPFSDENNDDVRCRQALCCKRRMCW